MTYLFSFRAFGDVFQQGEFRLASSSPVYPRGAAGAAALVTVLTYRSAPGDATLLDRVVLISLRLCSGGGRPVRLPACAHPRAAVPNRTFWASCWTIRAACAWRTKTGSRAASVATAFGPESLS
jgi:hypothetical protein